MKAPAAEFAAMVVGIFITLKAFENVVAAVKPTSKAALAALRERTPLRHKNRMVASAST